MMLRLVGIAQALTGISLKQISIKLINKVAIVCLGLDLNSNVNFFKHNILHTYFRTEDMLEQGKLLMDG